MAFPDFVAAAETDRDQGGHVFVSASQNGVHSPQSQSQQRSA